ncbi:enolase C-terminal domain-like protein [Cellulosimicrobium cellulans]|uniref:enolase C-terminal domain-like protein n=1 Tax=Cellulosimicrobium cellulans TaxID=1710 RepID=UPI0037F8D25C
MTRLTVRSTRVRAVTVPLRRPIVAAIGQFDTWPLVLVDVQFEEGVVGSSYVAPYRTRALPSICKEIVDVGTLVHGTPVAPLDVADQSGAALNTIGEAGISTIARAALDMALWDGLAKAHSVPLVELLGGSVGTFRAYNSNGLWRHDPDTLADEAAELVAEGGFHAIKLRLGHERLADDLRAIQAVREGVGDEIDLMVDFNQAFGLGDARRRLHELDDQGLYWFEEPVDYSNVHGYGELARATRTPLQMGENFYSPRDLFDMVQAGGTQYAMADLERIGGVTGWIRTAGLAEAAGVQLSNHLYPEFSVHLLRASATAHWAEWVDWAAPVLTDPIVPHDGHLTVPDRPGAGITWDEDAVAHYLVHEEVAS